MTKTSMTKVAVPVVNNNDIDKTYLTAPSSSWFLHKRRKSNQKTDIITTIILSLIISMFMALPVYEQESTVNDLAVQMFENGRVLKIEQIAPETSLNIRDIERSRKAAQQMILEARERRDKEIFGFTSPLDTLMMGMKVMFLMLLVTFVLRILSSYWRDNI